MDKIHRVTPRKWLIFSSPARPDKVYLQFNLTERDSEWRFVLYSMIFLGRMGRADWVTRFGILHGGSWLNVIDEAKFVERPCGRYKMRWSPMACVG